MFYIQHYGVSVPDLAGCFSAGDSIEDALESVKEAIELHLEGLLEEVKYYPLSAQLANINTIQIMPTAFGQSLKLMICL